MQSRESNFQRKFRKTLLSIKRSLVHQSQPTPHWFIGIYSSPGSIRGVQKINQDRCLVRQVGTRSWLMCVLDGHGHKGEQLAQFVKTKVQEDLGKKLRILIQQNHQLTPKLFQQAIASFFKLLEEQLQDKFILKSTGLVLALALWHHSQLFVANLGDCRVVLGSLKKNKWVAEQITSDHDLSNREELRRVVNKGGKIRPLTNQKGESLGPLRLWNQEGKIGLSVTRSLGDSLAKHYGVISKFQFFYRKTTFQDKIIVLGTDGLWHGLSNKQVIQKASVGCERRSGERSARDVVRVGSLGWGPSRDDISAIVTLIGP